MTQQELNIQLQILLQQFKQDSLTSLGYPCNRDFDYNALEPFLKFHINNAGDPYHDSRCKVHTHHQEIEVIEYFIELMGGNIIDNWGYITNGSTEGNLQGLYMAREKYPQSMVYYSEDSHYSIPKNIKILGMKGRVIKSDINGRIKVDNLITQLNIDSCVIPIIVVNIGTTMKGAIDDLSSIKYELQKAGIKEYYIHVDAALFGMILPFLPNHSIKYNFSHGIDSIAISGQKVIGSPFPTGMLLTKKEHVQNISTFIDYVNSYDTTITGSRNGLSALILWMAINTQDFEIKVLHMIDLANYTYNKLKPYLNVYREPCSPIIWWTKKLPEVILEKWQIAGNEIAHVVINSHMTEEVIDNFIADIENF